MRPAFDVQPPRGHTAANTTLSGQLNIAVAIGSTVFLASLFGLLTTSPGNLLDLWPANAILLGVMVRASRSATPLAWIGAGSGFVAAGLASGSALLASVAFCASNMVSVVVAYGLYRRHDEAIRRLKRSRAVQIMVINVLIASFVAGIIGALIEPTLLNGTILHGWAFRFGTELVNYLAILPIALSAPDISWRWLERRRKISINVDLVHSLPLFAMLSSCVISVLVGGPGALAFPLPALLWCSVTYSVFTTALLTFGFSIWTLMTIASSTADLSAAVGLIGAAMSIRMCVALVALAPISLSVVMEARNELMRRLLDIASRDQLTRLLNRHAFRERGNALLARLAQDKKPASLLMINIDHFKSVNETYGYNAGDNALANFSKVVSRCLRDSDLFGRLGGEEFAILLPDCSAEDTSTVAERIRKTVAETPIELGDDLHLVMTASIGTASLAIAPADIDPLLLTADSALYRAKKSGRNKVIEGEFRQERPNTLPPARP